MIKLFNIRKLVAVVNPLCISICAALLLDLKSNIKWEYILGLLSFFIFYAISNVLYNRCHNYGRIYDIEINEYVKNNFDGNAPERKTIYEKGEMRIKKGWLCFQYYGFIGFGILGLICIVLSYISPKEQSPEFVDQAIILQHQVDNFKESSIEQANKTTDNVFTIIPEQQSTE